MRAIIFLSIIALANYYVSARLFAYAPIPKTSIWMPVFAAILLFGLEMLDLRTTFLQTSPNLKLLISAATGAFFCLIFYIFIADIIWLIALLFPGGMSPKIPTYLFWSIITITSLTVVIGVVQAKSGPKIKDVTVAIKNLPENLEDYKIIQISDLHVGGTIRHNYVKNVVDMVNKTDADLIALTGDFADGKVSELKNDSALLANMKSKDGIYFVTGNHEYYHDWTNWKPFYQSLGIHVLNNRHEVIDRNGTKLVIAGVNDYSTREMPAPEKTDISAAAKDMPQDAAAKILLMHQPNLYKDAETTGFDLQLSGHTHGGQFFPWTLVVPFFHDYFKGLNVYKNLQIYISVGTGYWGPALRTFVPTEITVLTLKKA